MKILFFGTPSIAVPFLSSLHECYTVVGVVCQPDEPAGRGHHVAAPATKVFATEKGLPVFQPEGKWTEEMIRPFRNLGADVGVSVAYGRLMPRALFEAPRLGTLNVHFSLLPRYRGAAPMQWTLINGETETGVTIFWIDEGLDSGPVFSLSRAQIKEGENAVTLKAKLVTAGVLCLESVMADLEKGVVRRVPQEGEPSLAPLLTKELGQVDWHAPARRVSHLVAGLLEWPGVVTFYSAPDGERRRLKILETSAEEGGSGAPGTIVAANKDRGIAVRAGDGVVWLQKIQPEGKKPMDAWSFWNGARLKVGDKFS